MASPFSAAVLKKAGAPSQPERVGSVVGLEGQDPYTLFDLELLSSPAEHEVDRAFRTLCQEFHPNVYHMDDEQLATNVFVRLCASREALTNAELKMDLDRSLRENRGEWTWAHLAHKHRHLILGAVSAAVAGPIGAGVMGGMAGWAGPYYLMARLGMCPLLVSGAVRAAGTACAAVAASVAASAASSAVVAHFTFVAGERFCEAIVPAKRRSFYYRWLSDPGVPAGEAPCVRKISSLVVWCLHSPDADPRRQQPTTDLLQHMLALGMYAEDARGLQAGACLKAYTSESLVYGTMNHALTSETTQGFWLLWHFANYIHNMRLEMKYLAKHRGGWYAKVEPLYRGTKLTSQDLCTWAEEGNKFLNPTFMSTSRDLNVAESFRHDKLGNALIEVDCSKNLTEEWGTTYAIDIESLSDFKEKEKEVLFYPYSGFEVVSVTQRADGVWYIKLHTLDTELVETSVW